MRKYSILIFVLALLAACVSFVPYLTLLILLLLTLLMSNAYLENEPLEMLFLPELPSGKYMIHKINAGFLLYLKLSSPALLLYAVFHFYTAYLIVIPLFVPYIGISLFVTIKYTLYEANHRAITVPLVASIGMIGIIVPLYMPVTLLMVLRYYFTAIENLNNYLYVYNRKLNG